MQIVRQSFLEQPPGSSRISALGNRRVGGVGLPPVTRRVNAACNERYAGVHGREEKGVGVADVGPGLGNPLPCLSGVGRVMKTLAAWHKPLLRIRRPQHHPVHVLVVGVIILVVAGDFVPCLAAVVAPQQRSLFD